MNRNLKCQQQMADFWSYLRGPQIYTILVNGGVPYQANVCESVGNYMLSLTGGLKNLCAAVSPILVPYLVFRCHPSGVLWTLKCIAIFHVAGLFFRTFGRVTNGDYRKFVALLHSTLAEPTLDKRNQLKLYDYQSFAAPVDFVAKKRPSKYFIPSSEEKETQKISEPFQTLRESLAYLSAHTFGRRMLYPGATSFLKTLLKPALIDNRRKFIASQDAQRNVLQTEDENKIDSIFFDRRGKDDSGNTLVIAFEGNAGFYEAGIMVTPLSLNYSVLGFNVPGFGESTGSPYPEGILNSVEVVMQFAIEKLGFAEKNIVLYAWSIGGFPASWAAANYPNVRAVMLDASFDDLVP
uniref:AB hydrolase-1 domain-containing protein n=1 Tax=Ditylenchus dipsaci TaxID=166011 RepID=A0A915EFC7_9BILA